MGETGRIWGASPLCGSCMSELHMYIIIHMELHTSVPRDVVFKVAMKDPTKGNNLETIRFEQLLNFTPWTEEPNRVATWGLQHGVAKSRDTI